MVRVDNRAERISLHMSSRRKDGISVAQSWREAGMYVNGQNSKEGREASASISTDSLTRDRTGND